ncbi:DUF3300 domain-containing protein [Aestuariibacter halophilus]|uniref:DUF3300 domain-containing protein n=1 Tax=Fluctibacter halophilus TaxID=226011 RepID=A0ABS8GED2_9ALTE|nr:DUF3300 domain-containing protein [Aestuariibacter halophilus]MCC2617566.1 DUF3300 domain-containing protein [Aestuariibacter halophilus]
MVKFAKLLVMYLLALLALIHMATLLASSAHARTDSTSIGVYSQQRLDQLLAPIALYPDTLLTHVLVASTYPLDLIEARRWRRAHPHADEQAMASQAARRGWDPSIEALLAFPDLLDQLTDDLSWLQDLGDAFLQDEERLLAQVQYLRRQADVAGHLQSNDYVQVQREPDVIVIRHAQPNVIYVPYYDPRVIYGTWWHARAPYYWTRPHRYHHVSGGIYWSPRITFASWWLGLQFNWRHHHVTINRHVHRRWDDGHRRVNNREIVRWQPTPRAHRKTVRSTSVRPTSSHAVRRDKAVVATSHPVQSRQPVRAQHSDKRPVQVVQGKLPNPQRRQAVSTPDKVEKRTETRRTTAPSVHRQSSAKPHRQQRVQKQHSRTVKSPSSSNKVRSKERVM